MRLNQKGFSALEGLLVFVVVALLAGVGWYVWDQNKKEEPKSDAQNTQQTNQPAKKYYEPITIDGLGIIIRTDANIEDATFTKDADSPNTYLVTTPEYKAKVAACEPSMTDAVSTSVMSVSKTAKADVGKNEFAKVLKDFGTFAITAEYPNGPACSTEVGALRTKLTTSLDKALKDSSETMH